MTDWKRKLRNFPDNGSFPKNAKNTEKIEKIAEKSENITNLIFNEDESGAKNLGGAGAQEENENIKILGEMLNFFRKSKLMATLAICKNIVGIENSQGTAHIKFDENFDLNEIDQKTREDISSFFAEKGMSYVIDENRSQADDLEKLNSLLGGKLEIKNN